MSPFEIEFNLINGKIIGHYEEAENASVIRQKWDTRIKQAKASGSMLVITDDLSAAPEHITHFIVMDLSDNNEEGKEDGL